MNINNSDLILKIILLIIIKLLNGLICSNIYHQNLTGNQPHAVRIPQGRFFTATENDLCWDLSKLESFDYAMEAIIHNLLNFME